MARDPQLAVLFPGQGSQAPDMRDLVERHRPDLLPLVREAVRDDAFARAGEGTCFAQPAIFCAALAGWESLRRELSPTFLAGHSLGEVAALVAAGSLSAEDGLRVVAARGRLMQEAGEAAGDGGMLAVRAPRGAVLGIADRNGLVLANDNSPEQVVLSGPGSGLAAAATELREAGLRSKRLSVGGAFHSSAMAPAVPPFRELLERVKVRPPAVAVISCVTAAPFDDIRERLVQAITEPVRWLEVMHALHARGVRRFAETGPGRVLTGLVRKSLHDVEAVAPPTPEAAGV